jgi:hypothetical protein
MIPCKLPPSDKYTEEVVSVQPLKKRKKGGKQ